jgi:ATP-dependent RNA helicase DDX54/DBP10
MVRPLPQKNTKKEEKKESKSKKFWKLQSEKAKKKKGEKETEEFETIPVDGVVAVTMEDNSDLDAFNTDSEGEDSVKDVVSEEEEEEGEPDWNDQIKSANRKGKKSGGFQCMGLSFPIFKAIQHMGYKIPTPIQRKSIPIIQEGGDVVAMARTGSGKTAAFLIPLLEKLKIHSAKVGARALILSPSRELATQTLKATMDLAKYTDLRACAFVGGENMEDQFNAMASNPDIVIATPGRLMHLIIESNMQLKTVEYVVFDEADRLFEMGFQEQLREITLKLPAGRQTLLFSATLPKILVDFARAGLQNPTLIRLDVDTKISRDLQMYFFSVKAEEKEASLLYLLRNVISLDQQTVVFVATKHHVEYINQLLVDNGLSSTFIYGSLDQSARKIHLARFKHGRAKILVVTDVAARGIDIPLLDNVINFDFPSSSKVFVHRVGRTARAGKSGNAWSLVTNDEIPFMIDLQMFTGRPLVFASSFEDAQVPNYTTELVFGHMPMSTITLEMESIASQIKDSLHLTTLRDSAQKGFKMFLRSRPQASKPAYRRAKEILNMSFGIHPYLVKQVGHDERERFSMIQSISGYRPAESIFEFKKSGVKAPEALLMHQRRKKLTNTIMNAKQSRSDIVAKEREQQRLLISQQDTTVDLTGFKERKKRSAEQMEKEKEYAMAYRPTDDATEKGYSVHAGEGANFNETAHKASMDIVADDEDGFRRQNQLQWDSKKHRFVKDQVGSDNKKRIRTENGTLVAATFKSDRYMNLTRFERWKKKTHTELPSVGEVELQGSKQFQPQMKRYRYNETHAPKLDSKNFQRKLAQQEAQWRKEGLKAKDIKEKRKEFIELKQQQGTKKEPVKAKSELKTKYQITKERLEKEKRREKTGRHKHVMEKKKRK